MTEMVCGPYSKPLFAISSKQLSERPSRVGTSGWCERATERSQFSLMGMPVCAIKQGMGFPVVKHDGVGGICGALNRQYYRMFEHDHN